MSDLHHIDDESVLFDRIDDPVGSLANSVAIAAGQLLATRWARILGQLANSPHHVLTVLLAGYRLDLFGGGSLDQGFKSCHAA